MFRSKKGKDEWIYEAVIKKGASFCDSLGFGKYGRYKKECYETVALFTGNEEICERAGKIEEEFRATATKNISQISCKERDKVCDAVAAYIKDSAFVQRDMKVNLEGSHVMNT